METYPFFEKNKRFLIAIFPVLVILLFVLFFSDITIYFIIAWLIFMIGTPLNNLFKRFLGRNMAAALTLVVFLIISSIFVILIVPPLFQQAKNLSNLDYNSIMKGLEEPIADINSMLEKYQLNISEDSIQPINNEARKEDIKTKIIQLDNIRINKDSVLQNQPIQFLIEIENNTSLDNLDSDKQSQTLTLMGRLKESVRKYINPTYISTVFSSVFSYFSNFIIGLMSVLFISFFFLKESSLVDTIVTSVAPNQYESRMVHAVDDISRLLKRYFIGIIFQIMVFATFISIGIKFIGIKNAILIGFIAAILNVIPYLGPLLGALMAMMITVSTYYTLPFYDELFPILIKIGVVFGITQLFDNFIIQPLIFGKSVKAHPLEIFVVVLMGAKLGGIIGMVLAIPGYTVFRVIAKVFMSEFKIIQQLTKGI